MQWHKTRNEIKKNRREARGFGLIELVISILIFSILSIGIVTFTVPVINLWNFQRFQQGSVAEARLGLLRMTRELSQLQDNITVVTANNQRIQFYNTDDVLIDYEYQVAWGEVRRTGTTLVKNVTDVEIRYFNQANGIIANPLVAPSVTDIWRIEIAITVGSNGRTQTVRTLVFPRNLIMT